jgi:hypothetical protein
MSQYNPSMPIYGEYDAIVSGGGVIGVVCAAALAQAGKKVALVERRSLLGWEIGRARRLFSALPEAIKISPAIQELVHAFADWPQQNEVVYGPVAEIVFDRWIIEAGVDVLFQGWSSAVIEEHGCVKGLVAGTREGYQQLLAPLVIETDDMGRLIDTGYKKVPLLGTMCRSIMLQNTPLPETRELKLGGAGERRVIIRPISGGMSRADITLTSADFSRRDQEFHAAIPETIQLIRNQMEGCCDAKVFYIADEEWRLPAFQLQKGFGNKNLPIGQLLVEREQAPQALELSSRDIALSHTGGLILAGPWLPCYLNASSRLEDFAIMNRFLLGEALASFIIKYRLEAFASIGGEQ